LPPAHSSTISRATLRVVGETTTHATLLADEDIGPLAIGAAVDVVVERIFATGTGIVRAAVDVGLGESGVGCEDHGDEESGGESHDVEK
jgi:hypothetical protein